MECLAASPIAEATHTHDARSDFDAVTNLYHGKVFRFILASLREKDAAETLTQDCFLKAYLARNRFRNDCSIETWLMQIAVNLVRDYARNRRLQFWKNTKATARSIEAVQDTLAQRQHSPEENALIKEAVQAVWNAADKLSERQKTVFLLRFVEDMELLEIAAVTGMKEGTVKIHLFRALHAVREQIGARV